MFKRIIDRAMLALQIPPNYIDSQRQLETAVFRLEADAKVTQGDAKAHGGDNWRPNSKQTLNKALDSQRPFQGVIRRSETYRRHGEILEIRSPNRHAGPGLFAPKTAPTFVDVEVQIRLFAAFSGSSRDAWIRLTTLHATLRRFHSALSTTFENWLFGVAKNRNSKYIQRPYSHFTRLSKSQHGALEGNAPNKKAILKSCRNLIGVDVEVSNEQATPEQAR
ncbi:hypothetical protein IW262DRAFT_1485423 [Armillaria fumosa]|nr:hypothetical protein IW262DRAFT_1485423 [Armillaria fumosa]